tara:strand:+ start:7343 stop:9106 length:1764 start_codon:yes stop_codon:yes gene_type:complete
MKKTDKYLRACIWVGLLSSFTIFYGQEKKSDLSIQEVTIIKSYTPSLSEVFKIREQPSVIDSIGKEKSIVRYSIFSVPVASTFIPSKGSARVLQKKKSTPKHNATVSSAFGNFNNLSLDHSAQIDLDRRQKVTWLMRFNGLFKDLPDQELTTKQNATLLHLGYQHDSNSIASSSQLSFRSHVFSFYGTLNPIEDKIDLRFLDPKQQINYLSFKSQWQWYNIILKKADITAHLTTDSFNTNELQLELNTKLQLPIGSFFVNAVPSVRYINNEFAADYILNTPSAFASGISQMELSLSSGKNRFKFKIGATAVYGFGDDFEDQNIFVLPILDLSFKPKKGNFTPFLKVSGELSLNSFRTFSDQNPYTAPAIELKKINIPHAFQLGTRTKLVAGWEFTMNAYYQKSENTPLFRSFGLDNSDIKTDPTAFRYGNSFEVIYKEMETLGFDASVMAAFKNGGSLSFQAHWRDYSLTDETEPLNLPGIQFKFNMNIKIWQKIFLQANMTFWGAREHSFQEPLNNQPLSVAPYKIVEIPSFVDAEVKLTYQLNDRWDVHFKAENISNAKQFQWANYQVYGTRFLTGLRYNFDLNF